MNHCGRRAAASRSVFCEDAALVPKFEDETSDWLWEDIISQNMNYSQLRISTFFNVLTSNLEDFSNIQSKLKNFEYQQ